MKMKNTNRPYLKELLAVGLLAWALPAQAQVAVCERTEVVKDAIVAAIDGVAACNAVTDSHLAAIQILVVEPPPVIDGETEQPVTLQSSDFGGLTGLQTLDLSKVYLGSLAANLFSALGNSLKTLFLSEIKLTRPAGLTAGVFNGLNELTELFLNSIEKVDPNEMDPNERLESLPANLFDKLGQMERLDLSWNGLESLPDDIFKPLTNLVRGQLELNNNNFSPSFSPTVDLGRDRRVTPGATVTLISRTSGSWGDNMESYLWQQVELGEAGNCTGLPIDLPTVMLTNADTKAVSFTAPMTEGDSLCFMMEVRAKGAPEPEIFSNTSGLFYDWDKVKVTVRRPPPPPPRRRDDHANTAAQATPVTLDTTQTARTTGRLNPAGDVDYFTVSVPHAGVLEVETTGPTATVGPVWQNGEELAMADDGGAGRNFRIHARVEAGSVIVAVRGNGRQTGAYTLRTTLIVGFLENPGRVSFQSGIDVISGWVCEADEVEIEIETESGETTQQIAAYGTARGDTEAVCGGADNGFGLLFNWNRLGDGVHTVSALVDGVELGRATVTVTTLGHEFLRGAAGTCEVTDFPTVGESVTLVWQQPRQNFVIVGGSAPSGANRAGAIDVGFLENPAPNSFQSGVGVISGWVCEAETVEIELNGEAQPAAYGTERLDTEAVCGDADNGFGLLVNWNRLGDGEHTVVAVVDGEELGRATVRVTTLGVEFLRDVEGECMVEGFPGMGQTVTLRWQQTSQNFVITQLQ